MKQFYNLSLICIALLPAHFANAEKLPAAGSYEYDVRLEGARSEMLTFNKKIRDLESDLEYQRGLNAFRMREQPSAYTARQELIASLEEKLAKADAEKAARFAPTADKIFSDLEEKILTYNKLHTQYTSWTVTRGTTVLWPKEMFERMNNDIQKLGMDLLKNQKSLKLPLAKARSKAGKFGALGAAMLIPIAAEAVYGNSGAEAKTFDAKDIQSIERSNVEIAPLADDKAEAVATLGNGD